MDGLDAQRVPRWQRKMAATGALAFLICVLGCMSLNFGRIESGPTPEAGVESGAVTIPAHQTLDVFYPNPYVATPNLVVDNKGNDCKIMEQKPDQFRISNLTAFPREITWKARGEKVPTEVMLQNAKSAHETSSEPAAVAPAISAAAR